MKNRLLSQNILQSQSSIHSQSIAMFQSVHHTASSMMIDAAAGSITSTNKKSNAFNGNNTKIRIYQKNHMSIQDQRKNKYHDILSTMFDQKKK